MTEATTMELIAPGIWRLRLGEPEPHTPVGLREIPPALDALRELPAADCPFRVEDIATQAAPRGFLVEIPMDQTEDVYGLGLQLKSVKQTGKKKTLRMNSDPVVDLGDSHAPVPFYVSTRGYGVLVDTFRYADFYFGTHVRLGTPAPDATPEGPLATSTDELYKQRALSQRRAVVELPVARGVDLYFFAGPALLDAVRRYVLFSGAGCLPPLWGLGVWYRGSGQFTQDEALALARGLRQSRMPCDVFGLEPGWHGHAYACTFAWHSERFPRPQEFLDAMRQDGFRVNLWEHAFTHADSPLRREMEAQAGDVEVWGGAVPDFLCASARRAFADYHERQLVARGVAGFKLDECDNSDFIGSPWSFPEYSRFPSGLDGEQMHSVFGLQYQRTLYDVFQRRDQRTYGQVRASHALAAPYPFVLYSDLYDHLDFIRGVVNCGFSGLLWSPEVRDSRTTQELERRLWAVVFSPQALINAWYLRNPPWKQIETEKNNRAEFMDGWGQVEARCREILRTRMALLPYLYAAFARYRLEGVPPFRALVMDWPDDPACRDIHDQYMMGDDLLVAPLLAGSRGRKVVLPAGAWYCFWTRARLEGGRTLDIPESEERIPVFVREGALLPLAEPVDFVTQETCFRLSVRIYAPPGGPCRPCTLYEDDGETFAYEKGQGNRLELSWDPQAGPRAERRGDWPGRRYEIVEWC